jgi:hypothetical protein
MMNEHSQDRTGRRMKVVVPQVDTLRTSVDHPAVADYCSRSSRFEGMSEKDIDLEEVLERA